MKKEEIKELSIPIDNPSKITKDRREIARLKTVLRQKELAAKAAAPVENN